MGSFPHAVIIGFIASLLAIIGCMFKNRFCLLAGMFLSLTTASPMLTFTRGAAGALVPSDAVAFILLLGLCFGSFEEISVSVVPTWRRPFIILMIFWILSVLLISSWNMPGLSTMASGRVTGSLSFIPLNVQITLFRLFRVVLLATFFLFISRLYIDQDNLQQIFWCVWIITVCLALAQLLTKFDIINLQLNSTTFWTYERGKWVLGYTKASTNRILFLGFFVTLILIYKSKFFKWFYIASAVLIVASLFGGGSRAGVLGLIVGLCILSIRARLQYVFFVIVGSVFLFTGGLLLIYYRQPELLEPFTIFFSDPILFPGSGI